jgi:glycine dehydrogenase
MKINLKSRDSFQNRHNGPSRKEVEDMLKIVGSPDMDSLINETVPSAIQLKEPLKLPPALSEYDYIKNLRRTASKNKVPHNFIGQGYYDCIVPPVIQRNVLENPGWYTAYTPYQAEIAQGRLEALINFQTMVTELTGMEIANASLLDEGTAAAEAMSMFLGVRKGQKKSANKFVVDQNVFPQTLKVLETRADSQGIDLEITNLEQCDLTNPDIFGVYFQYPNNDGAVKNWAAFTETAKEQGIFVAVGSDLLALTLLNPPGEWGVDVVIGTSQRLGVPLGNGGPHAAFFATREAYKRQIPGRIIGVSVDKEGNPAYRMALQTREQHIKRERATSNICTAQVLLAVMSSMYGVYHGPDGLQRIAFKIHGLAKALSDALEELGIKNLNESYFDTLKVKVADIERLRKLAEGKNINLRYFDNHFVGISFDETHNQEHIQLLVNLFAEANDKSTVDIEDNVTLDLAHESYRSTSFMEHPVFNSYHAEHEMLRYIKRLENKDLSLVHSMISLGSCTMKLNATTEMIPVTWPEFGGIHPFAPASQMEGYSELIAELGAWLKEITGFEGISFQPNSGAQGEYSGLMVIRQYQIHRGEGHRNIALIPSSAHGTNPASAVMAGMKVVIVGCDDQGNIDLGDLKVKVEQHSENLAALMVTYPSTHGVFEEAIQEICALIHQHGGQVYMDGANMNAQVGITSPAIIGADVCHLNLHKTFCIPHGGGGPGMGPIGVAKHLVEYLPGEAKGNPAVSSAVFGSASILPISHAYIAMMGGFGLTEATKIAILNANYIGKRLDGFYPILYKGKHGKNAHELIIDCRGFKKVGIEVEDIAKRLMDYGYHAPTVSFPVPGTMMIEPTESETKAELDKFCDVMIAIREEIREIETGEVDSADNVLKNAPHTYRMVVGNEWTHPYSREKAAFPMDSLKQNKFWPSVARIDSAYGDRNLMCSCIPVSEYEEEQMIAEH